jgi:elongation factor Tu
MIEKGSMSNLPQDIEAVITFLRTEDGGKARPAFSGYRPQFYYQGEDWDARQTYTGVEQVNPGDSVTAQLKFLSPQYHVGKVAVGMEFQIREGNRTVATGRVTKILHLKENAATAAERFGQP